MVTVQNLSRLLEQDLAASFDNINLTLLTVVDKVGRLRSSGSLDASALNAFIARQAARLPELTDLRIADAQGDLRYGTGLQPNTLFNIAVREHFVRQHDRPDAGLVVGMPTVSRMNGKLQIVMSRRLNQPDGSFAGMVGAVIELDIITAKFATLDVGQNGILNLYNHELAMVSRYPAFRNAKPTSIGQENISREFVEQLRRTPDAGVFHASSPIDRLERTFSYRKSTHYPFYVIVGLATDDYLSEWWKDVAKNGIFMAVFALVTFGFAWLTVGAWTRREADLEVIRQQEQKFRTLTEMSSDTYGETDVEHRFTQIAHSITGLPEQLYRLSPLIGSRRWERPSLSPDEAGWQAHRALLDAHLPFRNFEIARLNPSGAVYYVTINGDPVFDAAGHFKGYQGVGADITERGQQEEKIRQLLKENATILSNALVGIAYIRQRRIVSCNRRFEDIFQYKVGELIGEGTGRLYDSLETFEHIGAYAYSEAAKDHGYTGEVRLRHKDGSLFWGTLNGKAVDPAHPHEGSIWIYADITKRKQDEEQLRIAATAFDSQEGMMITDADSVILKVNRAFTETTGYTAEEAVGQTPRLLSSGRHDKAFYAQMWEIIQRTGNWQGEIWDRRKNGEIYPN